MKNLKTYKLFESKKEGDYLSAGTGNRFDILYYNPKTNKYIIKMYERDNQYLISTSLTTEDSNVIDIIKDINKNTPIYISYSFSVEEKDFNNIKKYIDNDDCFRKDNDNNYILINNKEDLIEFSDSRELGLL